MKGIDTRYETEKLNLQLAGRAVQIIRVTNTDDLYASLIAKGADHPDVKDERIPYWADLWPSALALAEEVMESQHIKPGVSVLEIGCGLGLPGIAAGMKGASVVLSDYVQEPLDFAAFNWGLNLSSAASLALLDWREPVAGMETDLLLASDVAYEKRSFEYLLKAFRSLLKPGGRVLLSEPNRMLAAGFFANLRGERFEWEQKRRKITLNGRENEVCIYEIRDNSLS
jgi:predicted nicotinamide N-methyase